MDYYISPTGIDSAAGTKTAPMFQLMKAYAKLTAADTLTCLPGTYKYKVSQGLYNKSGTASKRIMVTAEPGAIFTADAAYGASEQDLIYFEGSFIHFKGFELTNFRTPGGWHTFRSENAQNCIFELFNVHHNRCGMAIRGTSNGNLKLNCDFHHNADPEEGYGGADGSNYSIIINANTVNTLKGCRSWWNSDDGFDMWDNQGLVVMEDCWGFYNGYIGDTFNPAGDGGGFKLGRTKDYPGVTKRKLTNCLAYKNRKWGFNENESRARHELTNCTAVSNGSWNYAFGWWGPNNSTAIIKNCISYKSGGYQNEVDMLNNATMTNNSWQDGRIVTDSDFVSLDDTQLLKPRKTDGSLPDLTFLKVTGLDLAGLGAVFQSGTVTPPPPPPVGTDIPFLAAYYDNNTTQKRMSAGTIVLKPDGAYVNGSKRNIVNYQGTDGKWRFL